MKVPLHFLIVQGLCAIASSKITQIIWEIDEERCPDGSRGLQNVDGVASSYEQKIAGEGDLRVPSSETPALRRTVEAGRRDLQSIGTFLLKLHWEEGYCWQRESFERRWCWQCPGSTCGDGDFLWTRKCDENNELQRFEWVQLGVVPSAQQNYGLLKTASANMCLENIHSSSKFVLRACNQYDLNQHLVGLKQYERFELNPVEDGLIQTTKCLTQRHHPKPYEEIFEMDCSIAQRDRSSYWEVYKPSPVLKLNFRIPPCTPGKPCGACEGDCQGDSSCAGRLKCLERGAYSTAATEIPGCLGKPLLQYADYCYDPNA